MHKLYGKRNKFKLNLFHQQNKVQLALVSVGWSVIQHKYVKMRLGKTSRIIFNKAAIVSD